jgi:lysophospholipase L1-like esterase
MTASAPASAPAMAGPPRGDPAGQMTWIVERFKSQPMTRIVAVGSSNTAKGYHCDGQYNWVDWLDVGLSQWWGRKHITINAGVSGQTCRQCLDRFDRDVALFQPNVVIVTVGGNDAHPTNRISPEQFRKDLGEMVERIEASRQCVAVLQTYYSFDIERMVGKEQGRAEHFARYMQIVREVARAKGVPLIDHLARWERLRASDPKTYRACMRDLLHLSPLGHQVFGLDELRFLEAGLDKNLKEMCQPAYALQETLDRLEREEPPAATAPAARD